MNDSRRIDVIQYLRGIAALAVTVAHITSQQAIVTHGTPAALPEFPGFWGVDIFFVISGFIIVYITRDVAPGYSAAATFFGKRIIRIVPAYWFFTLVTFAMNHVDWHIGEAAANSMNAAMLIKSLLFIKPGFPLLFVGWTLTLEMFFYLVFALCLMFFHHSRRILVVSGLFALLSLLPVFVDSQNRYFVFYSKPILLEFAAGMLIACACNRLQARHCRPPASLMLLAGITLLTAASWSFDLQTLTRYRALLWGIPAILIVAGALHFSAIRLLEPASKLGAISYSLYLCHMPCTYLSIAAVLHWGSPSANPAWTYCMLALASSLVTATASYWFFEKYVHDAMKKRFFPATTEPQKTPA